MADSPPPPPPLNPTTIATLNDDILHEIFLRLPDITSLARAAFACPAFLRAVRSSPAFRRRFRELHAPPLLAIFRAPYMRTIIPTAAGKSNDIADAFDSLLQDSGDSESEWRSEDEIPYSEGYACFVNRVTDQCACYNPHSQALNIYSKRRRGQRTNHFLEFYTLTPDGDEQRPSSVVCVHRDRAWAWARVAVFWSHTMEWQVFLTEMDTGPGGAPDENNRTGTVVNGFVCWVHKGKGCILALNTVTFQFSRMDLPPPLKLPFSKFQLGHTKDGKFCVVGALQGCVLSVWLWAADGDGVERFMLHKTFSLHKNINELNEHSEDEIMTQPITVISGFVYLCVANFRGPECPEWVVSFCLETNKVNLLHNDKRNKLIFSSVDPYIMVSWPSSLIHAKEDSDIGVIENISEDGGPMGAEEASPVLFTALQSFKEKIIDDDNSNFAEIESFLLDDERSSLLKRIATFESGLAAARDRVLRIGTEPNSMSGMEIVTSESELAAPRDRVLRIGTESDSMEGMERVSCWQMCKGILGRACSRFFTG